MSTPAIPIKILNHSVNFILRFIQAADIMLMKSGFRAIASVVMPGVIYCRAITNSPRYSVVLKAPNSVRCLHSFPFGRRFCCTPYTYASKIDPASKKRIVKRVNGSAEYNPNFPATDAEAQSIEKNRPVIIGEEGRLVIQK
jgi:hypothetical protein